MIHSVPGAVAFATAIVLLAHDAVAQTSRTEVEAIIKEYLAKNPEEVQRIVKDYLVKNPEVLQEAFTELQRRRQQAAAQSAAEKAAAIRANAKLLFESPRQVTLGNRQGDVTLVEFFDYNCGFCRRALADMLALMQEDTGLKVVLKELPVLGPASVEAARVSMAVHMQDPGGEKFLAFHHKLLSDRGRIDKARALAVAREVGLDVARIERDLAGEELRLALEESARLARTLGINGTPGYVIGETIVPGSVGAAALRERIKAARERKPG